MINKETSEYIEGKKYLKLFWSILIGGVILAILPFFLASIGALGYGDYPTFIRTKGQEYADKRRKAYRNRHAKNIAIKGSNGYYAGNLLW